MTREDALQRLHDAKADLAERFDVTDLALFGSFSRGEESDDSDVDILIKLDGPAASIRYFGVQFYLEDVFGRPVNLATDKAVRRELRPYIEREAIHV